MIDLTKVLRIRYPGCWLMNGESYEGLTWVSQDIPKPTLAELEAAWAEINQKTPEELSSEQLKTSIEGGFLVQPEGFTLALNDTDRIAFSQLLVLVKEALELGLISNDSPQIISDKNGQKHEISTLRFRQIMVAYGFYYKSIWDKL
jgi:hypothetical protein